MNGADRTQMAQAINEAVSRLARYGYRGGEVTDRDVLLAGFGFLADRIDKTTIRLDGKKLFALGTGIGGLVAGVLVRLLG